MNPWPFVIAAYAAAVAGTVGLVLWSWFAMRRAEAEASKLRRDHEA